MEVENQSSDSNDDSRSDSERTNRKRSKLSNGEASQKQDFISRLPDTLILDILSLLPVKHVASTTILSKRWRGLWTCTPVLNIDMFRDQGQGGDADRRHTNGFVSAVNCALLLYQSPKIEKLDISIMYKSSFSRDIDAWLLFALRKNVQEIQLYTEDLRYFHRDRDDDDESRYGLPPFLFKSSSLVTLAIGNCCYEGHRLIKWDSLKFLTFECMSLANTLFRDIFSGCPSLESLKLDYCSDFDSIESKNLQRLVISNYNRTSRNEEVLKISAPSLRFLKISGLMRVQHISLINSSVSLVKAKICFCLDNDNEIAAKTARPMFRKNLREIFEKLCHVKYLTLGRWCLQVLSLVEDVIAPFPNLGRLKLHTPLSPCDLPGITKLLELTPLLDTLIIKIDSTGYYWFKKEFRGKFKAVKGRDYWVSRKDYMQEPLRNLRTVKIVGFKGSEDEMEFIAFILNNAEHLEKMIIQRRKAGRYSTENSDWMCIAEKLLSYPRCCSATVVLFYEIL